MLLRRIIEHVKTQNWTAIALDFVIVVAGVFIGIQVANWNNAREAEDRAAAAIDRLHEEAEDIVSYFRRMTRMFGAATSARKDVLRQISEDDIENIDAEVAQRSVASLILLPTISPPRSVYDEIISSGLYAEIGDVQTREAINAYYASLDFLAGQTDYGRQLFEDWAVWRHPAMRFEYAPNNPRDVQPVTDIEAAFQDPHFVQMLMRGQNMQRALEIWWQGSLSAAEEMCRQTARFADRPCEPITENE